MADDRVCRVCCGENSEEEPLFYPCKCSGTIKYVHDNCLIKWLQYSRRRDCELCRTPFRFTKCLMYDPNMPKSMPIAVFLVRLLRRLRGLALKWLRTGLALFLWLGWLPWMTQCVWRFSLSLGDNLVGKTLLDETSESSRMTWLQYTFRKRDFSLRNLFRYKTINKIMMDVFEGQLITGIIVIIFIIILLCREWVMVISLNDEHPFESSGMINRRASQESLQENVEEDEHFPEDEGENENENNVDMNYFEEGPAERPLSANTLVYSSERWGIDEISSFDGTGEGSSRNYEDRMLLPDLGSLDYEPKKNNMNQYQETLAEAGPSSIKELEYDERNGQSFEKKVVFPETMDIDVNHRTEVYETNESMQQNHMDFSSTSSLSSSQNDIQENVRSTIVQSLTSRVRSLWSSNEENTENRERIPNDESREDHFENENDDMPEELGEIDGIIELSGIRGPISGLFQNCTVTSILIAIFLGLLILIPYVLGKSLVLVMVRIPHYLILFSESTVQKVFLTIVDAIVFFIFQVINESYMRIFKARNFIKSIANNAFIRITERVSSIYFSGSSSNLEKEVIFHIYGMKISIPPRIITLGTRNTAFDRTISIIIGYCILISIGALYLKKYSNIKKNARQGMVQRVMNDTLHQASLIIKFIVIVGIEVIAFPIYCGILIDLLLLDLFENANINTRLAFTNSNPFTSYFLHWFIGTAYMFQFALFVKMCRDIVRPGVLFFIHDPNDAQFHPIKEILERPIKVQLRKIFTSGIIYSCLICSCFSSVIYSVRYFIPDLFPLRLSLNKFLFDIPFDILALHILIPLTLKMIKPAAIAKALWVWWLKTISAKLRLTSFMFNGRHPQEEGVYVRKTLMAKLLIKKTDIHDDSGQPLKDLDVVFVRNGSFLRVPFKDNISLQRESMFIPVTEDNVRLDKKQDNESKNSPNFTVVYVPPSFIKRIIVLLFLIWIFAFFIGIMLTIPPLIVGRQIFAFLFSTYEFHDFYTYIFGCYFLGTFIALSIFLYTHGNLLKNTLRIFIDKLKSPKIMVSCLSTFLFRLLKIGYMIIAFEIFIPFLFGLVMDYYIIIPFNTYFLSEDDPVIYIFHDWALGILYTLIIANLIMLNRDSSLARSMIQIVHNGYLDPDIVLSTKLFIFPIGLIMLTALLLPLCLGYFISMLIYRSNDYDTISRIYRYSYPLTFVGILVILVLKVFHILLAKCRQSIRDEVYLIGEQLHNYNQH
ncbi:hypothetical protein T552_03200 [Pneumocystis carinii B80]|uniref:RING-type E3 ubiquitin transferase n=1 Tax=Pneumocystis carinii (strain B80) TaxID=1408658 RepID=A0A0W4ZC35_PNEC8|nr:hypothetical protein T552_03200 [Pneumocystis carinii B80]KTW25926.1 hypothetical protein T552_03200 [Pneumocystis carinii B80]